MALRCCLCFSKRFCSYFCAKGIVTLIASNLLEANIWCAVDFSRMWIAGAHEKRKDGSIQKGYNNYPRGELKRTKIHLIMSTNLLPMIPLYCLLDIKFVHSFTLFLLSSKELEVYFNSNIKILLLDMVQADNFDT